MGSQTGESLHLSTRQAPLRPQSEFPMTESIVLAESEIIAGDFEVLRAWYTLRCECTSTALLPPIFRMSFETGIEKFRQWNPSAHIKVWVAYDEKAQAVGYLEVFQSVGETHPAARIYVRADNRGKGIGDHLWKQVVTAALQRGGAKTDCFHGGVRPQY